MYKQTVKSYSQCYLIYLNQGINHDINLHYFFDVTRSAESNDSVKFVIGVKWQVFRTKSLEGKPVLIIRQSMNLHKWCS
jgi:hypothetical protein